MVLNGLPENFLKLVSIEGFSDILPNLSKFLKPGSLFQATVLKSFPEKNKALLRIANREVMVETKKPLTPGYSFSARVDKSSSQSSLKIVPEKTQLMPQLPNFEDKTHISFKKVPKSIDRKIKESNFPPINKVPAWKPQPNKPISKDVTAHEIKKLNLTSDQIISAKVVRILNKTTAVVKFQNKLMSVYIKDVSPMPGRSINVTVESHGEIFRLVAQKDVTSRPVEVSSIKTLLPFKEPFGEMIQKLESLVTSPILLNNLGTKSNLVKRFIQTLNLLKPELLPQPQQNIDSNRLKEQIDLSGINYEAKIKHVLEGKAPLQIPHYLGRDLKGQLLEILHTIELRVKEKGVSPDQHRQFIEIIKTFRRAIDNVELQQLTNQFARQENQPIVLQIPDPFFTGKTVKLYLKYLDDNKEERNNKENQGVLLVFLLDMSTLGNLRVDAQMNKEAITVKINVENKDVAGFIDTKLNDFCSRLGKLGFDVKATCSVINNMKNDLEIELNQLLIHDRKHLVDLKT